MRECPAEDEIAPEADAPVVPIDAVDGDDVRVTAIATGFGGRVRRRRAEAPVAAAAPSPTPVFSAPSVTDVEIDIPSFLKEE